MKQKMTILYNKEVQGQQTSNEINKLALKTKENIYFTKISS